MSLVDPRKLSVTRSQTAARRASTPIAPVAELREPSLAWAGYAAFAWAAAYAIGVRGYLTAASASFPAGRKQIVDAAGD